MNDLKSWAIVVGVGLAIIAVVTLSVLSVLAAIATNEQCQKAGGKRVCHTTTHYWVDHKGRTQYGESTDCRCLAPDGHEIVP